MIKLREKPGTINACIGLRMASLLFSIYFVFFGRLAAQLRVVSWHELGVLEGKGNCVPRELGVGSFRGKSGKNFVGKGNRWTCSAKVLSFIRN